MARANTKTDSDSSVVDLEDPIVDTAAVAAEAAEAPAVPDAVVRTSGLPAGFSGKRVKIVLHPSDGELGKLPAEFGINGYVIQIHRNTEVAIPEEFVQAIRDCSVDVVDQNGRIAGSQPRFNISINSVAA